MESVYCATRKADRQAIERINRRMGYRVQLKSISWPATIAASRPFTVETAWANAGVAPCYCGGFWALTLKDPKEGIAAVLVDERFDVRSLRVGPPDQSPVEQIRSRFAVALRHVEPLGSHAPPMPSGRYSVWVSVGSPDGTPRIALPMAGDDGRRRYRLGAVDVVESPK